MDIVVTIPKHEYANDAYEMADYITNDNMAIFWTLASIPKHLNVGDRVYFVKNSRIERSMKVIDIRIDSETKCHTTGRVWKGKCQLVMNDFREEKFDKHIKGSQGFRYFKTVMEGQE